MRKTGRLLIFAALLLAPAAARAQEVSLCDIAAAPETYFEKEVTVTAVLTTSYHMSFFSADTCPDFWFGQWLNKAANDDNARLYREAMETPRRMQGGAYDVRFTGIFHRPIKQGLVRGPDYVGVFEMKEITLFSEYSRQGGGN